MKQSNYILGGGIAGLIAHKFNPNFTIISPDLGGQLTTNNLLSISFYIHDHKCNRDLLDEIGVKYTPQVYSIRYYYRHKLLNEISGKIRKNFIINKMREYDYDSNSMSVTDMNLSVEDNFLKILDTDINEIIKKLQTKHIMYGKVKLINNNRKFMLIVDDKKVTKKLYYNKLISTIPANDFFYMLYNYNKSDMSFNYLPATFIISENKPDWVNDEKTIYYVCDPDIMYNRVQFYNGKWLYEITGMPDDEEIKKEISNITHIERRYNAIIKSEIIDDMKNIKFLGRYSEWNHRIHVEENIEKSKKIAEVWKDE